MPSILHDPSVVAAGLSVVAATANLLRAWLARLEPGRRIARTVRIRHRATAFEYAASNDAAKEQQ